MDWVFDLDGTLYAPVAPVRTRVQAKIRQVLMQHQPSLATDFSAQMDAFKREHPADYTIATVANVFGLDYEAFVDQTYLAVVREGLRIQARPGVDTIHALPGKKWVLTNSPEAFAHSVLSELNLSRVFDGVFGVTKTWCWAKPERACFERVPVGPVVSVVDDKLENLHMAHLLGWKTFWFPEEPTEAEHVSPFYTRITSLQQLHHLSHRRTP